MAMKKHLKHNHCIWMMYLLPMKNQVMLIAMETHLLECNKSKQFNLIGVIPLF